MSVETRTEYKCDRCRKSMGNYAAWTLSLRENHGPYRGSMGYEEEKDWHLCPDCWVVVQAFLGGVMFIKAPK